MSTPIRVLHVDDEPGFAEMVADYLEREDRSFTVITTTDPSDGLDELFENGADCIVSDYNMPGMNGLELLKEVRKQHPNLPFILFTGKGSEEIASKAIAAGVTDYLQKESGTDQYTVLANRIENAVTQFRAEQQTADQERILNLLRDINQALVGASTRNEIETAVTTILTSSEPYVCSWLGEYDAEYNRIVPQTIAGVTDESVSPTSLPDETADNDIIRTAVRTNELAVTQDRDSSLDVWSTGEPPTEYESAAVLPIVYHGQRYGLLAVYATRSDAFNEAERRMLDEIGGDIAQALHAADIHRTLRQHQTAVEAVPDGVFILDENATIELANESAASLIDRTPEEIRGESFPTFVEEGIFDESVIDWYVENLRDLLSSTSDRNEAWYETEVRRPDGEVRTIEIHLTLRPYEEEFNGTVGVIRDVTERNAEKHRFQALTERSSDIITILNADGTYQYQSPSIEHVLGYEPDEMVGENAFECIHPDDRERVKEVFERAVTDPDATPTAEYRVQHADGSWRWIEAHGNNELDNPAVEGFVVNSRDITERKQYERELERKNARLNEFAGILSHDLRNPLNVAQGRIELVRDEYESDHFDVITHALARMESLVDDVLTLTKQDEPLGKTEPIQLATIADACWQSVATANASLVTETERTIQADPSRLKQLLENLFRNAVEHGGWDVTITLGELDDGTGFFVEDDGVGIPPEQREEVFKMGYSTGEQGTGFGLSIVKQVADAHGWEVTVTESTSGGARFEFTA